MLADLCMGSLHPIVSLLASLLSDWTCAAYIWGLLLVEASMEARVLLH